MEKRQYIYENSMKSKKMQFVHKGEIITNSKAHLKYRVLKCRELKNNKKNHGNENLNRSDEK